MAALVCTRPWLSVAGTRCTRCGSGLVLEPRPRVVALHHERDLAHAAHVRQLAGQHLHLPAVEVGVALVHLEEVGGPEVALLAALAAADLDDDVLAVARDRCGTSSSRSLASSVGELRARLAATSLSRYSRISASDSPASMLPGLGRAPPRCALVRAVRLDHRPQLREPPPRRGGRALVAGRVELGELRLQLLQLGLELRESVEHPSRLPALPHRPFGVTRAS